MALLCLWLAGLAALAPLAVDVGHLYGVRAALQAAADLGALAGAQEVDLDALARGQLRLRDGEAARAAERWTRDNLVAHPMTAPLAAAAEVEVRVLHPERAQPARHPWSGRVVRYPTVAVRVAVRAPLPWTGRLVGPIRVWARADASVQFRR